MACSRLDCRFLLRDLGSWPAGRLTGNTAHPYLQALHPARGAPSSLIYEMTPFSLRTPWGKTHDGTPIVNAAVGLSTAFPTGRAVGGLRRTVPRWPPRGAASLPGRIPQDEGGRESAHTGPGAGVFIPAATRGTVEPDLVAICREARGRRDRVKGLRGARRWHGEAGGYRSWEKSPMSPGESSPQILILGACVFCAFGMIVVVQVIGARRRGRSARPVLTRYLTWLVILLWRRQQNSS